MDSSIQFIANYEDWVSIKKLKIEEKTDSRTIMEFLAGLGTGIDGKVEANLGKIVDLKKLDAVLNEVSLGKSEEEITTALRELNTRKVSAVIKEITHLDHFQANEKKELLGFCKVYAAKKILKGCGVHVDYSGIEIPGSKRLKKKKG